MRPPMLPSLDLLGHNAAAAAAKLLQLCPTLCDPIDGSPPGSPTPGILQARTLESVAISFSNVGHNSFVQIKVLKYGFCQFKKKIREMIIWCTVLFAREAGFMYRKNYIGFLLLESLPLTELMAWGMLTF